MNTHDESNDWAGVSETRGLRVVPGGERPAPASMEAEQALLSICLLDPVHVDYCCREKISSKVFHWQEHRLLWDCLVDLRSEGVELRGAGGGIETVVLMEALQERGVFEEAGGMHKLMAVTSGALTSAQLAFFVARVRDLWVLRRMIRGAETLREECSAEAMPDLAALTSAWANKFQRTADFVAERDRVGLRDTVKAAREAVAEVVAGRVDLSRVMTLGTPNADAKFLPLDVKNDDWFVVVAAPPSGGKSTFVRRAVFENLARGKSMVVFLLETSRRQWVIALAASLAGLNVRAMKDWGLFPKQVAEFNAWMEQIEAWMEDRLWVFDDVVFLEDIERKTREIHREVKRRRTEAIAADEAETPEAERTAPWGLDGIVVDHLGLIGMRERFRGKREEMVSHFSRSLKLLAKGLDLTAFVLSQLNREGRKEGRRPKMTDLRESGAIEQDADAILMLHTPLEDRAGNLQTGDSVVQEVELIQTKRRNGPKDVAVDLLFWPKIGRYQDAEKLEAAPGRPKPGDGYKRGEGAGL